MCPPASRPHALVTGASSGIGSAYARALARLGFDLTLCARRQDRLAGLARQLRAEHGIAARCWPADLSDEAAIAALARHLAESAALGMLVCAAGFGTRGLFTELDPVTLGAMNRLHVEAPVQLVRAALPRMIEARAGRIVLVSSLAGLFTTARYTTYGATKAYLDHFAEGLAAELRGTQVHVQLLCPGLTRTEFFDRPLLLGFRYAQAPAWARQSADEVVAESLRCRALRCVPGRSNRLLVHLLQAPLVGRAMRFGLALANRGGLY